MSTLTIAWVSLPFLVGFSIYLLPSLARQLALTSALLSGLYALPWLLGRAPLALAPLDSFSVSLEVDAASGYFILTNAVVTAAVVFYCWSLGKTAYFFTQVILLHGSVNAIFICADFISLYVALEAIGITAFLLISYPRTDRAIWIALRYLFVSNTAMLFYLIGAVLVYQSNRSFAFAALEAAPPEAIALIFLGLLVKGGVFVSGLWLPLTHAEADTPISALLSGVVVKTGVFPLLRCALLMSDLGVPDLEIVLRIFGAGTALFGVGYAMFAKDTKRMLAFHTISQLGFVLAAPGAGGFYALSHGLVKAALFLLAGNLPSRKFAVLKQISVSPSMWLGLSFASLSISGMPLLAGFGAKVAVTSELLPWQAIAMNLAALGTAISFAKFIFLPRSSESSEAPRTRGFWLALGLLLGGLIVANIAYLQAYTLEKMLKAIATIGVGWFVYLAVIRPLKVELPRALEQLDNLIGMMSVLLVGLFWMVLA